MPGSKFPNSCTVARRFAHREWSKASADARPAGSVSQEFGHNTHRVVFRISCPPFVLRKSRGLELADIHIPNVKTVHSNWERGQHLCRAFLYRNSAPYEPVVSGRSCLGCRIPGSRRCCVWFPHERGQQQLGQLGT